MTFEDKIIAGLIVALAAPLIIYLIKHIYESTNKKSSTLKLDLSGELPDKRLKLTLRHIRDGKDEIDDRGKIINKDHKIQIRRNRMEGVVKVRHNKALGFQYKCYVDFNNVPENVVFSFLGANNISETSYDESSKKRIWFLLPEEPRCKTVDGYENNYFHSNRANA